jgi:hypothetical protein
MKYYVRKVKMIRLYKYDYFIWFIVEQLHHKLNDSDLVIKRSVVNKGY